MAIHNRTWTFGDRDLTFESGKLALQAHGAAVVTYGRDHDPRHLRELEAP